MIWYYMYANTDEQALLEALLFLYKESCSWETYWFGLCHLLQNHVHSFIRNYEEKHSKVVSNISRISFVVLMDLLNFGIQLFLKKTH